jgi:hypothetical protein
MPNPSESAALRDLKRSISKVLFEKMHADKVSIGELARRMCTNRPVARRVLYADRLFNRIEPTLRSVAKAADALGLRLEVHAVPIIPAEQRKL